MTNYSYDPGMVRAEFFRPSGKWYTTEALDMNSVYNEATPAEAVIDALRFHREMSNDYIIIVMEPYHKYPYPVCLPPGTYRVGCSK